MLLEFQLGPDTYISHLRHPFPEPLHVPRAPGRCLLTGEASVRKTAVGLGMPQGPYTAQSSCGILESERRRGPLTKTEKKPLQKTNRANDALIQMAQLHKGPKQRFFTESEACIYPTVSSFGITGIKSWRMTTVGCSTFLIRSANGDVLLGAEV